MTENKRSSRFRYSLKSQRYKEQKQLILRELPRRQTYRINEVIYYLGLQGYHFDQNELFGKVNQLSLDQMIGIIARLGVEDQIERQMKKIFYFFSGGQDILTAQDLKLGMERLGEGVKERDINQIINEMDLNSNGYVDFQTFLEAMLLE